MQSFSTYYRASFLLLLSMLFTNSTYAQRTNNRLGIEILKPDVVGSVPHNVVTGIMDITKTDLILCQRFDAVDRGNYREVVYAHNVQNTEHHRKVQTVSQGKLEAVYYQLKLTFASYGSTRVVEHNTDTNRKTTKGYKGWLIYSYDLIDVETGVSVANQPLKIESAMRDTKSEALALTTTEAQGWLSKFLLLAFPIETKIVDIERNKSGKRITNMLMKCGTNEGVYDGCVFKMFRVDNIDFNSKSYTDRVEIGRINMKNVREQFSEAKPAMFHNKKILECIEDGGELYVASAVAWPAVKPSKEEEIRKTSNSDGELLGKAINSLFGKKKKKSD